MLLQLDFEAWDISFKSSALIHYKRCETQRTAWLVGGVGAQSTMDSVFASHPATPGLIPGIPKNFSEFLMLPWLINSAAA